MKPAPAIRLAVHVAARLLLPPLALVLTCTNLAQAGEIPFSKGVKASLVFRSNDDAAHYYPHLLKAYLRLDNVHDSDLSWSANPVSGVEAELLDADGKPVPLAPAAASIPSGVNAYFLPYGSRLDWLISHGGVSMMGDLQGSYALIVGGQGWLVPVRSVGDYTLHVRLRGWRGRFVSPDPGFRGAPRLLLDLVSTKIEITP